MQQLLIFADIKETICNYLLTIPKKYTEIVSGMVIGYGNAAFYFRKCHMA